MKKLLLIPIIVITILIILLVIFIKPSSRYDKLSVDKNKWNSIIASRRESSSLALLNIQFNDYNLILDKKSNTLYYSVVNESTTKYNPNVSYKATDKNAKIAILADELTDEKVNSDYKFKIMIYNDKEYHIYDLSCTGFPVINIESKENYENKQKNISAKIYIFDNLGNNPNRIMISDGKFKKTEFGYTFSLQMMTPR